jgi:Family of unknown function (DUF6130)
LLVAAIAIVCAPPVAQGQTAREILGPPAVVPLTVEQPPVRIIVDPPLPDPLSEGKVFIQYRVVNLRIEPVFGPKALAVSPRIGHIHVTVDGAPWHWADASGEPVILVGLPAGPHIVEIVLADANHQPLDRAKAAFVIPEVAASTSHH